MIWSASGGPDRPRATTMGRLFAPDTHYCNTASTAVDSPKWINSKVRPKMNLNNSIVQFFSTSENPVLFAGAGVSARTGIPSWDAYLKRIASETSAVNGLVSQMMMQRIEDGDLTNAADFYFACKIPTTQKWEILSRPLRSYNPTLLHELVCLPFKSIVTTNFDRSLLDAFAATKKKAPSEVNLNDPTIRMAPFINEFYIARIHGRIESPETMVLSNSHFNDLRTNRSYDAFLTHIFTRRQILFVGFSFLDPAILAVLDTIEATVGSYHHGVHLALLPNDTHPSLKARLSNFNIEIYTYDSKNSHSELWAAISEIGTHRLKPKRVEHKIQDPFDRAKRYLATIYARHALGVGRRPLRMAIFEGIVAEILRTHHSPYLSAAGVIREFRKEVHLPIDAVESIVKNALNRLSEDGLCSKDILNSIRYKWIGPDGSNFDDAIKKIVDGIINRYIVREGGQDTVDIRRCVDVLIRNLLLVRGWDLGAAFAARQPPEGMDLKPVFDRTDDCSCLKGLQEEGQIIAATIDVFQHPNTEEADILSELGRISFGVELVLEAPHDTIIHALTLPERIYLDTNILLPAIVPNHRFHDIYSATISKLSEAAAEALVHVEVVVSREFLEEVIGHKRIALEEIALMGPRVREEIELDVAYHGAENINVYLSGYINISSDPKNASMTFHDFLRKYAPYNTIQELENWLRERNILVLDRHTLTNGDTSYSAILHAMEVAFADAVANRRRTAKLIAHDAVQLAALQNDYSRGRRSIFVTADKQVREFVATSHVAHLGNSIISHVGLVQLVDLLIGSNLEARALTALLWSSRLTTRGEKLRTYFVKRALDEYDDALAMEMPELIEEITEKVTRKGDEADLKWESDIPEDRAKVRHHLEGFEDEYFQGMREAIERRRSRTGK